MTLDGFYSMTFRGVADWGIGMLVLNNGLLIGSDAAGVLYDGSYVDRGPNLEIKLTMTVPPGVTLVQGTPAQPTTRQFPVSVVIPKGALNSNQPVLMQLPPGPVNVIFRKLRELTN